MDLNQVHNNVQNTQTWVKLYDIMLDQFKGEGRCVTMDSVYMGDIMAQTRRQEWKMNMVGTTAKNHAGADVKEDKKGMNKRYLLSSCTSTTTKTSYLRCGRTTTLYEH